MKYQYAYIDTEFYRASEEYLTPVCASVCLADGSCRNFWVFDNGHERAALAAYLRKLNALGYVFCGYAFEVESRFMQSIGIDPVKEGFRCADLYIGYRQCANRFDEIQYGKHLVDGKVKFLKKPPNKWKEVEPDEDDEEGESSRSQMQYGLASATYKFTGQIRDKEDKDAARTRILQGGPFSKGDAAWIMRYCEDDTKFLPELHEAMMGFYEDSVEESEDTLIGLSDYAIRTAEMVRIGYPVNRLWLDRVVSVLPSLIRGISRDLREQTAALNLSVELEFERPTGEVNKVPILNDDGTPALNHRGMERFKNVKVMEKYKATVPMVPLSWDKSSWKFTENQKVIQAYIEQNYPNALKTDKGNISLDEESLEGLRTPAHLPPKFLDHFVKFRKLRKTLRSLAPTEGKKCIYDYLGSDNRVRPHMGIFGAQTSRSQPAANSFIFLKDASLRFLVHPQPGKVMFGIDYKSQEFVIGAALSGDDAMLEAYRSGDAYLYLAKNMSLCPEDATRKTHDAERNTGKLLELALGYGMGTGGVASKIGVTHERAAELIKMREGIYWKFIKHKRKVYNDYFRNGRILKLKDGWTLGPNHDNSLSVGNFPGQGHGGVVMRRAVALCQGYRLSVVFTLHDALYFECELHQLEASIMLANELMKKAFFEIMDTEIFTEVHAWGLPIAVREERRCPDGTDYICDNMFWESGKVKPEQRDRWYRVALEDNVPWF